MKTRIVVFSDRIKKISLTPSYAGIVNRPSKLHLHRNVSFHYSKTIRHLPLSGSDHIPINEGNAIVEEEGNYEDEDVNEQNSCKYFNTLGGPRIVHRCS